MTIVTDRPDYVIGVDTHKESHTLALTDHMGAKLAEETVQAEFSGYKEALSFAKRCADGKRLWAIEGTGSYGSGLCQFLIDHGEEVTEIDRPKRVSRRSGAKSDAIDAHWSDPGLTDTGSLGLRSIVQNRPSAPPPLEFGR